MKIGNVDLGNKLILAPMADITDSSFRTIAKKNGAGLTFTQMVSAKGVVNNNFDTLKLLVFSRSEKPIGVQLLGNNPEYLSGAVKELIKLKPELIDLNCGCPVDKVTKYNMGADLLDDPKQIGKLVNSMVKVSEGVPISVKVRLGRDKKKINIIDNAKAAEDNGASLITIHTRTRSDKYDAEADWDWLRKVKESVSINVVGNGSVFTPQDIKIMRDATGCDSVMIARGALGNPFIFSRYNQLEETGIDPGKPSADVVKETVVEQLIMLSKEMEAKIALDRAKKQVIWYFKNYPGVSVLLNKIFAFNCINEILDFVEIHTKNLNENKYPPEDNNLIQKKFEKKVLFWLAEDFELDRCIVN